MRLLDTQTLEFRDFLGSDIPPYAILSHTWGEEEVSYQDMLGGKASVKKGYEKIQKCCEIALSDGFKYAWVDTCCIDKTSSAELSEAINSMYLWYQKARVCYVTLSDVPYGPLDHTKPEDEGSSFRRSRWFTRGWTLQELIAPACVIFYDKYWTEIGTKSSLKDAIIQITGIHDGILSGERSLKYFSVAQKMSWASSRKTTRPEDTSYCLMGIFDVNMPLIYGEGKKAFFRLQEQIINASEDDSILAWMDSESTSTPIKSGCLAYSPVSFARCRNITWEYDTINLVSLKSTYSLTSRGFHIHADSFRDKKKNYTWMVLNCRTQETGSRVLIKLFRQMSMSAPLYFRLGSSVTLTISDEDLQKEVITSELKYLYVSHPRSSEILSRIFILVVETEGLKENGVEYLETTKDGGSNVTTPEGPSEIFIGTDSFWIIKFHSPRSNTLFNVILNVYHNRATADIQLEQPIDAKTKWKGCDRITKHVPDSGLWVKVNVRPENREEVIGEISTRYNYGKAFSPPLYKVMISWDEPGDGKMYEPVKLYDLLTPSTLPLQHHHRPPIEGPTYSSKPKSEPRYTKTTSANPYSRLFTKHSQVIGNQASLQNKSQKSPSLQPSNLYMSSQEPIQHAQNT